MIHNNFPYFLFYNKIILFKVEFDPIVQSIIELLRVKYSHVDFSLQIYSIKIILLYIPLYYRVNYWSKSNSIIELYNRVTIFYSEI